MSNNKLLNKKAVLSQGNRSMRRYQATFMLPETRIIAMMVWVYLIHTNFRGGLRKRMHCAIESLMAFQGHPRSLTSTGTNRKRLCNFLLVINSNLGPIIPRFRDIIQLYSPQMVDKENKKAVLSQGNRAMPQLFFSV